MDSAIPPEDIPGAPPPKGQISNFDDPKSRANLTIIVCSIFMGLMVVFGTLRIYSRLWLARTFSKDDYACVAAMVCLIVYAAITFDLVATGGIGPHQWDVRIITYTPAMIYKLVILQVGYPPAILFTKLSLFLMYLRIFSPSLRTRYLIFFGITFIVLFYVSCLLVEVISCTPRSGETRIEAQTSKRCARNMTLGYVMAAFNVFSDFYLLAIPIPVVWKLQLPLRRKVGVSAVFMTGFLACICSIVNTYYRIRVTQSIDATWNLVPTVITSIVEICVGVMVGCMPHLASLFRHHFQKALGPFSFKYLKVKFLYPWSRRSKGRSSDTSAKFDRVGSDPGDDMYLETRVLGSVQGQGKFLDSGIHPQKQWIERDSRVPLRKSTPTIREAWND